ncbi:hypothetical protein [Enhygromyxa salina]|uniref:hypothetical protein n=1 Tax=Enhygromyxa salina TaxID=215803 RepID=UPI0011BA5904|nr:hypothetical protein [Enhygromyxa salina]
MSSHPRAFIDWWNRGGESWTQHWLDRSATRTDIPPGVRSVIDPDTVPAEILCASADCDPLASGFVDTFVAWGLKLEAYERRRYFYDESTIGNSRQHECDDIVTAGSGTILSTLGGRALLMIRIFAMVGFRPR